MLITTNCTSSPSRLNEKDVNTHLAEISNWLVNKNKDAISHEFNFKNYYQTLAFINAVAWIVHQENHHPDIEFSYNKCSISFNTHSVNGLSLNDFICAAKVNKLYFQKK